MGLFDKLKERLAPSAPLRRATPPQATAPGASATG